MESKPQNRPNPPGTKAAASAWIDSSSKPKAQDEELSELEQLQQENTYLLELNAEKEALLSDAQNAYIAIGLRLEKDQEELADLKKKAQMAGALKPSNNRRQ
jgi:pyruvate/2-oxoacid:ferredoxin oxidoreductase alpha subunit